LAVAIGAHLDDAAVKDRLDIRCQRADGLQLTDSLRQRVEVLKVIAHCGNVVLHQVVKCRDIGIVGHTYTSSSVKRTVCKLLPGAVVSGISVRESSNATMYT